MELIALQADRGVHCDENGNVYLWENQARVIAAAIAAVERPLPAKPNRAARREERKQERQARKRARR